MTEDKFAKDTIEMIESLPAETKDASLGFDKATGVRATALMMAVKYADTATIKDGVMYQAKHAMPLRITRPQSLQYHDPDRPDVSGPIIDRAHWPWSAFDDWCGEHTPKEPSP